MGLQLLSFFWETKTLRYSIDFVIKLFMMINFFSAAKLFNSLACRFFSVHHFANDTLLKKIFFLKIF